MDCIDINWKSLSPKTFYELVRLLQIDEIILIFENVTSIDKFYKIPHNRFVEVFKKCNDDMKKKLINCVDVSYLTALVKNDLIRYENVWENKEIYDDIEDNITEFNESKVLSKIINYIDDYKFKKIISKVHYYDLNSIYDGIKCNKAKLLIFINGINYVFLNLLINSFDDNMIDFIRDNLNFIIRLEIVGKIFVLSPEEQQNVNLSKLQIITLLGTNYEHLIVNQLLKYECQFVKKVINKLSNTYFKSFFNKIKIDLFNEIIYYIEADKLEEIVDEYINIKILISIMKNTNASNLDRIIPKLSMQQILFVTYELNDEKVIFISKCLNLNQQNYIINLFNRIPYNEINNSIPTISKQLLCYLYLCPNIKHIILDNIDSLNCNQIIILAKLMNGCELYNCLKKIDLNKKTNIYMSFTDDQVSLISNVIDKKLDLEADLNIRDKIIIRSMSMFLKLNLSKHNLKKIKS